MDSEANVLGSPDDEPPPPSSGTVPLPVTCKCGKQFQTEDENAGRRARCPECGNELIVPAAGGGADMMDNAYLAPGKGPGLDPGLPASTSGKAITSLVLGIFSLVFCCNLITGIPAIIFGALGLGDIERSRDALKGRGMATAGIVMGGIGCTLAGLFLIALLFPAVQAAREATRRSQVVNNLKQFGLAMQNRSQCVNNLKQIGLAMHNYHSTYNVFPPAVTQDPDGKPLLSWRVLLLPFLEQNALYQKFKLDEPWDSPTNKALLSQIPNVYRCPSWPGGDTSENSIYQVLIGPGTLFEKAEGMPIAEVTDGTSNTLMVVESKDPIPWSQPSGLAFTPKTPIKGLGSYHPGVYNALFADGSVKFIKLSTSDTVVEALVTRNGGEVIDPSAY